jgi:hypothetical protein
MSEAYIDILENGYMIEFTFYPYKKIYCKDKSSLYESIEDNLGGTK